MNSSKASFVNLLNNRDFLEEEKELIKKRKKLELEAKIEASKPKISEQDLENAKKQAYDEGFLAGKNEALEEHKKNLDNHLGEALKKINNLDSFKDELEIKYKAESLFLLKHILENLFEAAISHFPEELLKNAISSYLKDVKKQSSLKINLNCKSIKYLKETLSEEIEKYDVLLVENNVVSSGNALLEWAEGGEDARIDVRLNKVIEILSGEFSSLEYKIKKIKDERKNMASDEVVDDNNSV